MLAFYLKVIFNYSCSLFCYIVFDFFVILSPSSFNKEYYC